MSLLLLLSLLALASLFLLSKCFFLAPYRVGWLMYLANVGYETLIIKAHLKRSLLDGLLFIFTISLAWLSLGAGCALGFALVMAFAWMAALLVELRWIADVPATQHRDFLHKVPLPIPRLILMVRGPVLSRSKKEYNLGDWPAGHEAEFEIMILNSGTVRPQLPLEITIQTDTEKLEIVETDENFESITRTSNTEHRTSNIEFLGNAPEPGQLVHVRFSLMATVLGEGGRISIRMQHGDLIREKTLRIHSVFDTSTESISSAEITRWPYGANGAFNWRGDHDLYDPCTFQSEEGLRKALGLAARYRMPTSIMLSARLSLVEEEHRAFCEHHGWDRRSDEIPSFIEFLKNQVDMRLEQEFPIDTQKPFSAEIGNHFYLHYATHIAADPGNEWKSHARMGEGTYPWMTGDRGDTFAEQRDNAVKGSDVLEETLGTRPASFTIPGDAIDAHTARALDAADIEVGTETDANKLQKLLLFPKEHVPEGCRRMVELTRVLPRDPQTAPQIAMLKFWVAFAGRNHRAMVYLAHHHMVMYEGMACLNLTAELLRYILEDMEGDIHSATLTSLGRYWRDVLSEDNKSVLLQLEGQIVSVTNKSGRSWKGVPVEVTTTHKKKWMVLVDVDQDVKRVQLINRRVS